MNVAASYLFSFYPAGDSWGLVFSELLTAQIFITTVTANSEKLLEAELIRFFPDEILIPAHIRAKEFQAYFKKLGYFTTIVHDDAALFQNDAHIWAKKQFPQSACAQLEADKAMQQALYYFYAYMAKHQRSSLDQFNTIFFYQPDDFLIMDAATQRNLELVKNAQDGTSKNSLLNTMDKAKTAMGSRMLKKWILRPLVKKDAIVQRQDVVALCCSDIILVNALEQSLLAIGDCERVVGRIALQRATVLDYIALSRMLTIIPQLHYDIEHHREILLMRIIADNLGNFAHLSDLLSRALHDDPTAGFIIKEGFDEKLDHMRVLVNNSNEKISSLELAEQKATGINSLKIRYNQCRDITLK